jgi:V/A-type H+/Na+-transporting ATPase subunit E
MTEVLNPFVQEIEDRKRREMSSLNEALTEKKTQIQNKIEESRKSIEDKYEKEAASRSQREAARIRESARLTAKKIIFDSINENMEFTFEALRNELRNYVKKAEYKKILEKMVENAKKHLGTELIIKCRKDDEEVLNKLGVTIGGNIDTLGGVIASDKMDLREIDMTFEELIKNHEDEIKTLLMEKVMK